MTLSELLGIAILNALLLVVGVVVLRAVRGPTPWQTATRLAGLAYMTGVAVFGIVLVAELSAGLPFSLWSVLGTIAAVVTVSLAVMGRRTRRSRPVAALPSARRVLWLSVVGAGLSVLYLEGLFRSARLEGLYQWDAMAFWVPKAEAIYYFGGLHGAYTTVVDVPYYPPLVPALSASAFEFMGRPDAITLHVLWVFFLGGFLLAVYGLLAERVPAHVLWPLLLLLLLAPAVVQRSVDPQADMLLDYFVALGALLCALWLSDLEPWQLILAAVMLGAASLTKREGLLLSMCVLGALAIATWPRRRSLWPRIALLTGSVLALSIPWRLWTHGHQLASGAPAAGYFGFVHHLDRALPSLHLTLRVLFAFRWWFPLPLLFLVAIVAVAAARGATPLLVFACSFFVLATLAASWVTVSFPTMPITTNDAVNPIQRLAGGIVVPAGVLLPLIVASVPSSGWSPWRRKARSRLLAVPSSYAALAIAVVALAYPAYVLAEGAPRFPSARDCSVSATHDGNIDLVLGTFTTQSAAERSLARLKRLGYVQATVMSDGCGAVKVAVPGYTTVASAASAVAEARRAGVPASAEFASP